MRMTRPGTLAGIFAVCAIVAWLATRGTFTNLPLLPITAVPALAGLAIAEAVIGRYIRRRLTGRRPGKPLAPIAIARLVALAKASSAGGAAIGGLAGGYLVFVLGRTEQDDPRPRCPGGRGDRGGGTGPARRGLVPGTMLPRTAAARRRR